MKYPQLVSTFLICCFSISCVNNKQITSSLHIAEAVMQAQPDSALIILQTLDWQQIHGSKLQALYALLYTQALDKNGLPISNDSLIHIAVDYYSRKKEYRRLGWAWFYLGKTYMQMDSITLAMTTYFKIQELLKRDHDDYLLGMVTNEVALLHQEQRNYEQALTLFRQSLSAFQRTGNKKNEGYVLSQIADIHYFYGNHLDSVQYYYDIARTIAIEENDLEFLYILSASNAVILRVKKEHTMAQQLLNATIQEYKQGTIPVECYPLLSALYLDLQQIDSARYYMLLILQDTQITLKQRAGVFDSLRKIEEQAGDLEAALQYAVKHKALSDTILLMRNTHTLQHIEQKYHFDRLVKENLQQKVRYFKTVVGFVLLAMAVGLGIRYWWKKHLAHQKKQNVESLKEFKRSSLLKSWDFIFLQKEFKSGDFNLMKKELYIKVIESANFAYPGLLDWLRKYYPQLNNADIALTCLLLSEFEPKSLCAPFQVHDVSAIYTRCSRLYQKLGIKTDAKDTSSFRNQIINLYVDSDM